MTRKLNISMMTLLTVWLLCLNAFAYTGESDLSNTIRALKVLTGQTSEDPLLAGDHVDGDRKIGLGEAIYWMQDAAGVPFVDLSAQDYEEDFLLSALALEITEGQRQEVVLFDTPRVGMDDLAYNRDDLIITPIKGEGVAEVEIEDETDSIEDTYYYIRGLSEGVAVFRISYDGYSGQKPLLAVNVVAADAAGPTVETDITLTKYDTIYFTGENIDFTFMVTTDETATLSAELNGTTYAAMDGRFTVPLTNGYNPIIITAVGASGTTTRVVNLRAKKISYAVVNTTRTGSELFYEGDVMSLNMVGLVTPVPKVSRIYNPAANRVTYDTDMPRYSVITGTTAQYSVNSAQMELTAAGDYVLTGGHIDTNWFGSALYSEVPVGTQDPWLDAPQSDRSFSILPDIAFTVLKNPDYDPELFTITVTNTEEIWPGDEVIIHIPDLDIDTIDANHPEDDDSWEPATIIESYTVFRSDIPGLDTVASEHAEINDELENLRTIRFMVPEETEPGTYQVRGGYVWVKYGPSWWTKVAYYHKAMIPDVTIEVKAAVPGQVHGVVPIESDTLKSRLAGALGLGADYSGELTSSQLKSLTGSLDLSNAGITNADMALMQYLTGVTAIDLSNNPAITAETVKGATFDWTLEKSLDFSGCTGLTALSDRAFYQCAGLAAIVLPDTITALGAHCFFRCTALAALTLPANLTTLGERCFGGCTALVALTLPGALETIGDHCFGGCTALIQIIIPDKVTALGDGIFSACESLQEVQLPANLVSMGAECFKYCAGMTHITLPSSLTSMGDECFRSCDNLNLMTLPASLTTIGGNAFQFSGVMVVDARESAFDAADESWGLDEAAVFLTGADAQVDPGTAVFELNVGTLTLTHQIPGDKTVIWSSSDSDVAVAADGVVTGLKNGTVLICARAADGTYGGYSRVTVTDSGQATLSTLALSGITLNEAFDSRSYLYTAAIEGDVRSSTATLYVSDAGATLTVNGQAVTAGDAAAIVALAYPETVIEIDVTSADSLVTKRYVITVTMAAITEKTNGQVAIGNPVLKDRLAAAAGKETGIYTENLTIDDLAGITGAIDLSDADLRNRDMVVVRYLTGVSVMDFSDNTLLTSRFINLCDFDWTTEKRLDFSGCTGVEKWHKELKGAANLTGIVLPETVTHITGGAFQECYKLKQVVLPGALTKISDWAFSNCSALTEIDLPQGLETMGSGCFRGTGLTGIVLPSSLTSLGKYCFAECEQLTDLTIPAGVTDIGYRCFRDSGLALLDLRQTAFTETDTQDWYIPDTTLVVFPGSTSAGLDTTSAELTVGEEGISLSHAIPAGYTVIFGSSNPDVAAVSADGVVYGTAAGTAYITVSSADGTYFDYCRVTLTETDTPGLASLILTGATLDQSFDPGRVYYTAGADCFSRFQLTADPADPSSTLFVNGTTVSAGTPTNPVDLAGGENIFSLAVTTAGVTRTYTIVVSVAPVYQDGTGVSIANDAYMQRLAAAAGKEEGYSGPLTYDELAAISGTLDLSGLGLTDVDMAVMTYLENVAAMDLSDNPALTAASAQGPVFNWTMLGGLNFAGCTGITEIVDSAFEDHTLLTGIILPETITRLGKNSFAGCTALGAVEIPSGVTEIDNYCFEGAGIQSISLPAGLTTLGVSLFRDCIALTRADLSALPVAMVENSNRLFRGCTAITDMADILLPQGITTLPDGFFQGCTGITAMDLPGTITILGNDAIKGTGLIEADLSGMTEIGTDTLAGCRALTRAVLPEGITSLWSTFNACTALTSVDLPDSLTSIGISAFQGSGITHLVVPAGVTSLGYRSFNNCNSLAILDLSATSLTSASLTYADVPSTTTILYAAQDAGLPDRELNLTRGENATLTHSIPEGTPVAWLSSNTAVATVSNGGVVTAVSEGTALIAVKADDGSYNGTCEVTVTAAPDRSISLN